MKSHEAGGCPRGFSAQVPSSDCPESITRYSLMTLIHPMIMPG